MSCRKTAGVVLLLVLPALVLAREVTEKKPAEGMIRIPAGFFLFGSPRCKGKKCGDAGGYKKVFLAEFFIDREEATVVRYLKHGITSGSYIGSCQQGPYLNPIWTCSCTSEKDDPSNFACHRDYHVAGFLPWAGAKKYCEQRGLRLPTEMEWEKAARATDGRPYPWGQDEPACNRAVISACGLKFPQLPCTRPAGNSPYGVCDMLGNVGEWVVVVRDEGENENHFFKGGSFWYPYNPSPVKPYLWKRYRSFPAIAASIGVRCAWSDSDYNLRILPEVAQERGHTLPRRDAAHNLR